MNTDEIETLVQANIERYEKKHGLVFDDELLALKLTEEVGECVQALLIYKNKCRVDKRIDSEVAKQQLSEELADVLGFSLALANNLDIDIWAALDKKWLERGRGYLDQ